MRSLALAASLCIAAVGCGDSTDGSAGSGGGAAAQGGMGGTGGAAAVGGGGAAGAGGAGGTGATGGSGGEAAYCNAEIGLTQPAMMCTAQEPCTAVLAGGDTIDQPTDVPLCATSADEVQGGQPAFDDGPPLSWQGQSGVLRHRCEYRPTGTAASSPRPLVLFFHGTGSDADVVYNRTRLRQKAIDYDLSGDPLRPGFILVSSQGRNLHWPTIDDRDESHHDVLHRDLTSPSGNPDVANTDRIIDELVAEGVVDVDRIYLMGWSNGGVFAQLYAIARHATPTPGGNQVAAAAVYSASDPFHMIAYGESPSCQLSPYPSTTVPIHLISRNCDIMACSPAQHQSFIDNGGTPAPGSTISTWVQTLTTTMGNPNVAWTKLTAGDLETNACVAAASCTAGLAVVNHVRWPDGHPNGQDKEPTMLDFLASHGP